MEQDEEFNLKKMAPILNRIPEKWGKWIRVRPGWFDLVLKLNDRIATKYPDYECYQVKEKFGSLRYYCEHDVDEDVSRWITETELECDRTCDVCGSPGTLVKNHHWLATRCLEHTKWEERW